MGVGEYEENQVLVLLLPLILKILQRHLLLISGHSNLLAIMSLKWANTKIDIKIEL